MKYDERKHIRKLSLLWGFKTESRGKTRKFKLSNINFDAQDYIDIIPWEDNSQITKHPMTKHPMTKHISNDSLKQFIRKLQKQLFWGH